VTGRQQAAFIAFWGYVCLSVAYATFKLLLNLGVEGEFAVAGGAVAFAIVMLKVDKPAGE